MTQVVWPSTCGQSTDVVLPRPKEVARAWCSAFGSVCLSVRACKNIAPIDFDFFTQEGRIAKASVLIKDDSVHSDRDSNLD